MGEQFAFYAWLMANFYRRGMCAHVGDVGWECAGCRDEWYKLQHEPFDSELKAEGEPRTYPNMGMWDAPTETPRFHKHAYRQWFDGQERCISCGHLIIVDQELHDRVLANSKPLET